LVIPATEKNPDAAWKLIDYLTDAEPHWMSFHDWKSLGGHTWIGLKNYHRLLTFPYFHDNDGSADLHLPVGQGTVDWAGLVDALREIGYRGFLELEFQGRAAQLASRRYLETRKLKCAELTNCL
jgi:sugar phosphate isomerase/epimerase